MTTVTVKRFTLAEYHRLAELGFLGEDDRVELIRGEIIQIAAKGTSHSVCNSLLFGKLVMLLGKRAIVRGQDPIILPPHSEPEPDIVIARNKSDFYLSDHPSPSDVFLVIQVADSTLKYDQEIKLALYAESGISDYWIFNLVANCLEVYSEPLQDLQGNFGYASKHIYLPNAVIALPSFPDLSLNLAEVFPSSSNNSSPKLPNLPAIIFCHRLLSHYSGFHSDEVQNSAAKFFAFFSRFSRFFVTRFRFLVSRYQVLPGNAIMRLCLKYLPTLKAEPSASRSQVPPGNEVTWERGNLPAIIFCHSLLSH